jgi:hypothetical protein
MDIHPALRRALMRVHPDYFTLPVEAQERYRMSIPKKDRFLIEKMLLEALFHVAVNNENQLNAALKALSEEEQLTLNKTWLPIKGIGEDYFFLNEYLDEGKTLLDFGTLHNYDYDDHCFQQRSKQEQISDYASQPYRGSLFHTWARLSVNGEFHYASLCMAAGYVYSKVEETGYEKIDALIPHRYVPRKDHGKRESTGTIFSQRADANGMEPQLDELQRRFWAYLSALFDSLAAHFDQEARHSIWLIDRSEGYDPQIDFIFSDKSVLPEVKFRSFLRDCRRLQADVADLEIHINRERANLAEFLDNQHQDIVANFNPKIAPFKKKTKIILADGALNDLL